MVQQDFTPEIEVFFMVLGFAESECELSVSQNAQYHELRELRTATEECPDAGSRNLVFPF